MDNFSDYHNELENLTSEVKCCLQGLGNCSSMCAPGNISSTAGFQFYMYSVAGNIVAVLGLIGNIFSMVVLLDCRMRSSTSVYLFALAVSDSIILIAMTLFFALPAIYIYTGYLKPYMDFFPYMLPIAYPISLIAQMCSIYTTVSFTVERFIAVCRPLKAAEMCTIPRARRVVLGTFIFSVIYNIPRMLEYKVTYIFDSQANMTQAKYVHTTLGKNATFRHIYFLYLHIPIMVLLPFLILAVFNTLLIRAVKNSVRTYGRVNNRARRENNLTIMLITVVVIFLLTQVVSIVDNINGAILSTEEQNLPENVKLTTVSTFMVILNSATNFYIYCVFGRKFRRVFCHIFCRYCVTNLEVGSKENNNTSLMEGGSSFKAAKNRGQRTEQFRMTTCKSFNAGSNGHILLTSTKFCKPTEKSNAFV